ncbi:MULTISPECIES: TonB-dependent receptor domain-containing protein [unclassified Roseovarius]|uniref:TonB-dependent receptor domain-containing protein n=1 Tax=unclassified Roseovarius TaxID=2614913 RepID=UPI0000687484|nr:MULTISPECIES: TonB-dependent receptor [unclassified Roseovarius]EAQ25010.1 putative Hemin receptor protein HmuR [Roseovarius sp. 217]KJS45037.1 MAG: ligand-gated channel [Roseovarius sp. BRH_c41]
MGLGHGSASLAQETPAQEGFLGTLTLGESKRTVQTETATPSTVIDEDEIRDRQAGSVAELLVTVPSVALLNGDTAQGSGISIRGFGSNATFGTDQKVLIQVDGATRGSEELYRIGTQLFTDPFLFKEVEVIRGTVGSFQYGSGVVGGVVRLETIDPEDVTGGETGFGLRQTLEFQTNGNGVTSSSIGAWQPTEDFGVLFNYVSRRLGFPEDGNGAVINPLRERIDDPSWLVKAKYRFGEDKAHSIEASYQDTQSSQFDVPYDSFGNLTFFGNVDREVESQTSILKYNFNPLNDLVDLTLQYSHVDEAILQDAVSCPGSPPAPITICSALLNADHDYETTTLTLKNTSLFDTGALRHDLTAGIEHINRTRVDAFAAPGGEDNRWALFAVDEIDIGRAWTLTPAIRYETSKVEGDTAPNDGRFSEDALMGGLSVRYAFNNGLAVFGSAAYTEVLPIIDDLEFPSRMTQSEKSRTYEVGFSYDRRGLLRENDALALKVTYFDSELWDVNSFVDTTPAQNPLDEIQTQGLEFEASYAMENGFYVDLNATVAEGEEVDVLGGVRDWRNLAANNLRASVGKVFDDTYDLSWEVVSAESITVNGVRDDGYTVHNLRATIAPKRGVWDGTEFRVGIENLFDAQFTPNLATRPSPGRNFKLTLAKTF